MSDALVVRTRLDRDANAAVESLSSAVVTADGVEAFGEASMLRMRNGGGTTWLLGPGADLTGVAHLAGDGTGELAVHPATRRHGHGARLLSALEERAGTALAVWAHGDLPAAQALARRRGFTADRVLLQLGRSLERPPLPPLHWPAGVRVRSFRPGPDDTAWLAVNARSFAGHPEQGRWTLADLQARQAQTWFDPAGFLLAVEDGADGEKVLGFHWTKTAGRGLGEVYVLGVDPDAQGRGLGPALTIAGLQVLSAKGLQRVMLYAEATNEAALRLYDRLGFSRWAVDVTYQRAG